MSIEEAVLENLKILPPSKRLEVLEFAEYLSKKVIGRAPERPRTLEEELTELDQSELTHLELEFENYDQRFPLQ